MNRKWHPNWLIFFTIALFITALTVFITTFRDQFGLKTCVYGDTEYTAGQSIPGEPQCFCNENGEVVCEENTEDSSLETTEYVNEDLEFSSSFLNFVDTQTAFESVRFDQVSTVKKGLEIVVERLSMCDESEELPPQIGYYMFDNDILYLTTSTNLLAGDFNKECMVSNTFMIHGLSEVSKIVFQSEDETVLEADICVYGGKVFNKGDAFVGEDGEVVVCE
jgi:hypothetical protein